MPLLLTIEPTEVPLTSLECDALVVGVYSSADGPRLSVVSVIETLAESLGVYSRLTAFDADLGDVRIMPAAAGLAAKLIMFVGFGQEESLDPFRARAAASTAGKLIPGASSVACALHLELGDGAAHAAMEGFLWGLLSAACLQIHRCAEGESDSCFSRR